MLETGIIKINTDTERQKQHIQLLDTAALTQPRRGTFEMSIPIGRYQ